MVTSLERNKSELAPIILFAYNRLWHLKKTVDALKKNALAKDSILCIYSDGPKNEEDMPKVHSLREYLQSIEGFKKVQIIKRKENWGLAKNIIDGVTQQVDRFGKVIVLEDDIVASEGFLRYMNDALDLYKNEKKIMHISAYTFPLDTDLPELFFSKLTNCWGWGTWRRAWRFFEKDAQKLLTQIDEGYDKNRFNFNIEYDLYNQLLNNAINKMDTWAVKWYASVYINDGLALTPSKSLTNNIGFDGSGTNCNQSEKAAQINPNVKVNKIPVIANNEFISKYSEEIYRSSIYDKMIKRLTNHLKKHKKDILIHPSCKIAEDAKIEIRYGGKILIYKNTEILDGVLVFSYGGIIDIGEQCSINPYTIIYGHGNVKIGNRVLIAGHCMIIPSNHVIKNKEQPIIEQGQNSEGIVIEDDVWIGHGCTILDGVTIGKGSVIAAGSVVNEDIPSYEVFGGVPAKHLKKR